MEFWRRGRGWLGDSGESRSGRLSLPGVRIDLERAQWFPFHCNGMALPRLGAPKESFGITGERKRRVIRVRGAGRERREGEETFVF